MAYKKGQSGNPAGRKKGVRNKNTIKQEEAFFTIFNLLEERLKNPDTIDAMSLRQLAELYSSMLNYVKPKLSSTTNQNTNENSGEITVRINYVDIDATDEDEEDEEC